MPIVINVPNSGLCSATHAGTTVSDCVHYTSVKRREWNCLYERRSVTALYSRSFHRSSQSDNTKSGHLAYTVGVSAHLHKIAFRPASSATMAEDTSQSEGTGQGAGHAGGSVRRPRFNALEYLESNHEGLPARLCR